MTFDSTISPAADPAVLRGLCGDAVYLPGDAEYDAARMPWNVAVDQKPAAVAYPGDASDVVSVVRAAAAAGLRVAPQGTGHNAGPLGELNHVVLLRTSAMTGVAIDPKTRRARVEAGTLWQDVVAAAAEHGLAALHGSSPDVGVAGYSLGGGIGWYARELGLQCNRITAAELVTADGSLIRVDAGHDPDLFWALRGGGGSFGVVTALEFDLFPIAAVYAGMLVFDWQQSERVLTRWAEWAAAAPESGTTAFRILQVPPLPDIPEPFRGRQLAVIDGAVVGDDETGAAVIAPLRELQPEMDTFAPVPAVSLTRLHMDPEGPTPAVSDTVMLSGLPAAAIEAMLAAAGPGSGSSLLMAELRQLGGALGRPHPDAGALPMLDGQFVVFGLAMAPSAELAAQGHADARRLVSALAPYSSGRHYLNFAENPVDASTGYTEAVWARLQAVRATVDPTGVFVANHPVPVADGDQ